MSYTKFWNKNKNIDVALFCILLILHTVIMFILFQRQVLGSESYYHSDMKAYILEMQGLNTKYSFPYPIFFKLGALFHLFVSSPELSIALAATVLNAFSPIFLKYYMDKTLSQYEKEKLWVSLLTTVVIFSIFFVSMVYIPGGRFLPGLRFRYVGIFSPNPFHNATYMATRPFSIVCFFVFAKILLEYEKKINWKDNIVFAVFLLLTTMTKPSFTFVLVPAAGLIMLYRLIRSRFSNFVPTIQLGICFIPTFCALLYQFFGVFGPIEEGESGIGFGIATAWKLYSSNILFSVLLAAAFPIAVFVFNYKEVKKEGFYRFSLQLFLMSFAQVFFLYEKGFRLPDMNFSWGYMHGIFFAFVASLLILIKNTYLKNQKPWILGVQWLAYLGHFVLGILYFSGIFMGGSYY